MNNTIDSFTRTTILEKLETLPDGWQKRFRQMYGYKTPDASLAEVVAAMPEGKLDWALTQIENSAKKVVQSTQEDDSE